MGGMLSVPRDGGDLRAYLAVPDEDGPHPGVVVIHEIYGLSEHIRDVADRFARSGYAALAVDLFSTAPRPVCMARVLCGQMFRPVKNGVVRDLEAALRFLGERPPVDPRRLGVIGFCMGGGYALQLACVNDTLKAASVFYGFNPRPLEAVARACPLVGSYPERDITAGHGRKLDAALGSHQIPRDIKIYPGARHSFFNDQGRAYDASAAQDAWQRTLAFFATHLGVAG